MHINFISIIHLLILREELSWTFIYKNFFYLAGWKKSSPGNLSDFLVREISGSLKAKSSGF